MISSQRFNPLLLLLVVAVLHRHDFVCYGYVTNPTTATTTATSRTSTVTTNANELFPLKKGSTCALVTPFKEGKDGESTIDVVGLEKLLQYHLDAGTDNLCILGTTAEAATLDMNERATVIETCVNLCKGKIPLLCGTGTIDPVHVKEMTMQAIDLGCDANLVVTPYYVKPPQRGLIQHFIDVAHCGLPVIIYNVPGRTGVNMLDESIVECVRRSTNIVGMKDATGDLNRLASIRELLRNDDSIPQNEKNFLLFSGDDATTSDYVLQGGHGCISVTANIAPRQMHTMMHAALQSQQHHPAEDDETTLALRQKVQTINKQLENVHKHIFVESNPIPIKYCMKQIGLIDSAYVRLPLMEMDNVEYQNLLQQTLEDAKLIET